MLVNISWNADHQKGPPSGPIPDEQHAKWLLECVLWWEWAFENKWYGKYGDLKIVVSATSFKGILEHRAGSERDYLWAVWNKVKFIWCAHNPGHHQGCCLAIRMGLEAAGKSGEEFMIHTAEDVVPHSDKLNHIAEMLEKGMDYVGMPWGHHDEYLNAQFFACRVQALVPTFDPGVCTPEAGMHSEKYLKQQLEGKKVFTVPTCYEHSHDYNTWKKHLEDSKQ